MRKAVAAAALAVLALGLPASAKPKPPPIAGAVLVMGFGTVSVDVTVPKGVSLTGFASPGGMAPRFAFILGGPWSGVALLSRGGAQPFRALQAHSAAPDHCPSQSPPPGYAIDRCGEDLDHAVISGSTAVGSGITRAYPIPAGTYELVVSGPPRVFTVALLTFSGVKGVRQVLARRPVRAAFQRARDEDMARAATAGAFKQAVSGNAVALLGAWHATSGGQNGAYTVAECVTAGAAGPADPPGCAAGQPAYFNADAGPATADRIGNAAWLTPVLKKGTYVNSYDVSRTGAGPAAGAFVWWLQADALR